MILFDKEKEIIFKITNAVLLLWFIGALMFTFSNIIDIALDKPSESYESYKQYGCMTYDKNEEIQMDEDECLANYNRNQDENDFFQKKSLLISLANVLTVLSALVILNRKPKKIK